MQKPNEDYSDGKGRTTIDDSRREQSYSERARRGTISVIKLHCPHCAHTKAFSKPIGTFCTACGWRIK